MMGWALIRKSEFKEYKRCHAVYQRVVGCHRWFSGWKDLDIIWNYLFTETYYGDIGSARDKYADARHTDEYGKVRP